MSFSAEKEDRATAFLSKKLFLDHDLLEEKVVGARALS